MVGSEYLVKKRVPVLSTDGRCEAIVLIYNNKIMKLLTHIYRQLSLNFYIFPEVVFYHIFMASFQWVFLFFFFGGGFGKPFSQNFLVALGYCCHLFV